MKNLLILSLACFTVLSTEVANAKGWNSASLTVGQEWNANPSLFPDTFAATIWGTLKKDQVGLGDDEQIYDTYYLKTPYYGKSQAAYLITQKQGDSPFTEKAPLMVIIPGIFSTSESGNAVAEAQAFYQNGYHVLVLSSPWSTDLIGDAPVTVPGDIESEVKWVRASIQQAVSREINPDYVSSISLYGESYGAFLAAMTVGSDDANAPLITGKTMLVGPPLNLMAALQQLDAIFNDTTSMQSFCKSNEIGIGLNFIFAQSSSDLGANATQCAKALVAMSFNGGLKNAMSALVKTKLNLPPGPYEVSFQYYVNHFAPSEAALCSTTDKCKLSHWVNAAVSKNKDIEIVSSRDDFLNVNMCWDCVSDLLPDPAHELILLNWGGHLGYVGSDAYQDNFYTNYMIL